MGYHATADMRSQDMGTARQPQYAGSDKRCTTDFASRGNGNWDAAAVTNSAAAAEYSAGQGVLPRHYSSSSSSNGERHIEVQTHTAVLVGYEDCCCITTAGSNCNVVLACRTCTGGTRMASSSNPNSSSAGADGVQPLQPACAISQLDYHVCSNTAHHASRLLSKHALPQTRHRTLLDSSHDLDLEQQQASAGCVLDHVNFQEHQMLALGEEQQQSYWATATQQLRTQQQKRQQQHSWSTQRHSFVCLLTAFLLLLSSCTDLLPLAFAQPSLPPAPAPAVVADSSDSQAPCPVSIDYGVALGQPQPGDNGTNMGVPIFFGSFVVTNNENVSFGIP